MATRTERVVLELESNLATGLTRDAAAVALLKRELGTLDGSNKKATTSTKALGDETDRLSTRAVKGRNEIDKFSGRLTVLAQVAAGLGPSLIPIAAVGIPAAAGLANELGGVALGAGTALLAFHGLGEGLTALNKAALDPTVSNLQAAQLALEKLPPSARDFARELSALQPTLLRLREAAASGLFPGLEDAIHALATRSGEVEKILHRVGAELGDLSKRGAEALSGPEWDNFFKFVSREAPRALEGLGRATGDVVHGLAELWMAFTPLNHDFTGLIVDAADGFDRWATGLSKTQGFHDFIDYLRTNGPLVADAVVAIGNAVLQIVEAAAPLGGPILQALTAVANVIADVADSNMGPTILATVTALSLLSRAQASFGKISSASWVQAVRGAEGYQAKVSAARPALIKGTLAAAGLAIAASGVADQFGLSNTATLALTGSLAGPWGAAAGGAVGLLLDMSKNSSQYKVDTQALTGTLDKNTGAITQNTKAYVAQQLQQQGVLDDAQTLGLSLDDVTKAALGNADAYDRIVAVMQSKGQLDDKGAEAAIRLRDAILTQSGALKDGTRDVGQLNAAVGETAPKYDAARSAAELFRLEIDRVNDTLAHRAALRDYQQALDDLATSLDKNGKTLDINTQAGRDNQAALDAIADSAIKYAQTLKGADRDRFLAHARTDFIRAAEQAGLAEDAAKKLATRLGLLNEIQAHAKVYVDGIPQALANLEALAARVRAINRETARIGTKVGPGGGRSLPGYADGGEIPGQRSPYGDKVLIWAAPGEHVISNRYGEADAYRAKMTARRYADGGSVAASRTTNSWTTANYMSSSSSSMDIDYGRLTQALLSARPVHGDVHISGDPTAYRREMEQDRRRAAMGAVASRG